jgi:hypothetical protein
MKNCKQCKELKKLNEFHTNKLTKDGLRSKCKACYKIYYKNWYLQNRSKVKAKSLSWRINNPGKLTAYHLNRRYGLTTEQYDTMWAEQCGCCAICDQPTPKLVVDHNHKTGRIRQLLCPACNRAIGSLQESPSILRSAAAYLEFHQEFK